MVIYAIGALLAVSSAVLAPQDAIVPISQGEADYAARFGYAPDRARILNAVLARSGFIQSELEKQGGTIAAESARLRILSVRYAQLTKLASSSQRDRDLARSELYQANLQIADLARKIAENNSEVAIYNSVVSDGILKILELHNPKIKNAFERYIEGDVGAVDEIQALVTLDDDAEQAASRKTSGAKLRLVATMMDDEFDNGRKKAREALAAWQRAADRDPENIEEWLRIAELSDALGNDGGSADALRHANSLAKSSDEKALVASQSFGLRSIASSADEKREKDSDVRSALRTYSDALSKDPSNTYYLIRRADLLRRISGHIYVGLSQVPRPLGIEQKKQLNEGEDLLRLSSQDVDKLRNLSAGASMLELEDRAQTALEADYDLLNGRLADARRKYQKVLQEIHKEQATAPQSVTLAQLEQATLSHLADLGLSVDDAMSFARQSATDAQKLHEADPDVASYAAYAWFAQTGLGLFARRLGKYEIAEVAFKEALDIGRGSATRQAPAFMVSLTIPRLAVVEMALGHSTACRALWEERLKSGYAAWVNRDEDPEKLSAVDVLETNFDIATTFVMDGQYDAAFDIYHRLLATIESSKPPFELTDEDRQSIRVDTLDRISGTAMDEGRYDLAVRTTRETLRLAKKRDQSTINDPASRLDVLSRSIYLADMPGGKVAWRDLATSASLLAADKQLEVPSKAFCLALARLAELRKNLPQSRSTDDMIHRFKSALDAAYADYQKTSDDGAMALTINYMRMLAITRSGGISFRQLLDFVRPSVVARSDLPTYESIADFAAGRLATGR